MSMQLIDAAARLAGYRLHRKEPDADLCELIDGPSPTIVDIGTPTNEIIERYYTLWRRPAVRAYVTDTVVFNALDDALAPHKGLYLTLMERYDRSLRDVIDQPRIEAADLLRIDVAGDEINTLADADIFTQARIVHLVVAEPPSLRNVLDALPDFTCRGLCNLDVQGDRLTRAEAIYERK